ncbi:MAG: YceD family protein, partial [Asticcacaulis sp.]
MEDPKLWEHKVRFDAARTGLEIRLTADEARRKAIASDFGMVSLDSLTAVITTRNAKGMKSLV